MWASCSSRRLSSVYERSKLSDMLFLWCSQSLDCTKNSQAMYVLLYLFILMVTWQLENCIECIWRPFWETNAPGVAEVLGRFLSLKMALVSASNTLSISGVFLYGGSSADVEGISVSEMVVDIALFFSSFSLQLHITYNYHLSLASGINLPSWRIFVYHPYDFAIIINCIL